MHSNKRSKFTKEERFICANYLLRQLSVAPIICWMKFHAIKISGGSIHELVIQMRRHYRLHK
jgi:hypothetical protein